MTKRSSVQYEKEERVQMTMQIDNVPINLNGSLVSAARSSAAGLCNCVHMQTAPPSHLFKERHGKLLMRDAVSGCADVFFGLVSDVEVNPHQDVFLHKHREHTDHQVQRQSLASPG